jgi:transposase-like protein
MKLERHCPRCEADRTFGLAATTQMHLGKKSKWHCPECDFGFVTIDGAVDTASP